MTFRPLEILRAWFGAGNDAAAAAVARRWSEAFRKTPGLATDLIGLGGILTQEPVQMVDGYPQPAPIDPYRLAYEAGRRDLAILLLAQGGISNYDLSQLMEEHHVS